MVSVNIRHSKLSNRPAHEVAATQVFAPSVELERMVSCCLLGENQFYVNGQDTSERIFELAHQVEAPEVARIAVSARTELGLRHVPLWLLVALANRQDGSRSALIRASAERILRTPKDALDLVSLYWKGGKRPLPWSFKRSLADGFDRWTEFQLRRYATLGRDKKTLVRLRDLLRLIHPRTDRNELFRSIAKDAVTAPDTWESLLPRAEGEAQKREVWVTLLSQHQIGALAVIRNLRNMTDVLVPDDLVRDAIDRVKASDVWPWQALSAAKAAPQFAPELERLMLRSAGSVPTIKGRTGILVDVSGSMNDALSSKSQMFRYEAAAGVAIVLREACETSDIFTFSNDLVSVSGEARGVALATAITGSQLHVGTYLGPAVQKMMDTCPGIDRLIVLTDEQAQYGVPAITCPLFIVNLASYQSGVDFAGEATRINGWSGNVIRFLAQQINGTLMAAPEDETNE